MWSGVVFTGNALAQLEGLSPVLANEPEVMGLSPLSSYLGLIVGLKTSPPPQKKPHVHPKPPNMTLFGNNMFTNMIC